MLAQLEAVRAAIEAGIDREDLRKLLPPGGARNALDCALWELEAQRTGIPVWKLAGLSRRGPLLTTFTVGADAPGAMAARRWRYAQARGDQAEADRRGRLDIGTRARGARGAPGRLARRGCQPGLHARVARRPAAGAARRARRTARAALPRGREADLDGIAHVRSRSPPTKACRAWTRSTRCVGRFDVVNIKLDKCGGLTEGLLMAERARALGLQVMVGNMVGTSLAMAPAFVLGQLCDVVDLDGPIFLAQRPHARRASTSDGMVSCDDSVWGGGQRLRVSDGGDGARSAGKRPGSASRAG